MVRVGGRVKASSRFLAVSVILAGLGWLSAPFAPADGEAETEKVSPTRCDIKGKVEGKVVKLTVTFDFFTEKQRAVLQLPAVRDEVKLTDITLDGRLPNYHELSDKTKGYVVHVDRPGDHKLTLAVTVPLTMRSGGTRHIEIDLPRTLIVKLRLELPPGVKDLRSGPAATPVALTGGLTHNGNVLSGDLGLSDKLQISWKGTAVSTDGPTILESHGDIQMQIEADGVYTTKAKLDLKTQSGQTDRWQILTPPGAVVRVDAKDEPRIQKIEANEWTAPSGWSMPRVWTVTLRDTEPITVFATVRGKLPDDGAMPVGPFAVFGEARQWGDLRVYYRATLDLIAPLHPESSPRQSRPEEQKPGYNLRSFAYVTGPPDRPLGPAGAGALSLLIIRTEKVPPVIKTQVSHQIELQRKDGNAPRTWQLLTTITATKGREGADKFVVVLPSDWQYQPPPPGERPVLPSALKEPVVKSSEDEERLTYAFLQNESWTTFTLTIRARSGSDLLGESGTRVFQLPLPSDTTIERQPITVKVPDDLELTVPEDSNPAFRLVKRSPHEQVWQPETADRPYRLTISWRKYQPEVHADSVYHVFLAGDRARVIQELKLHGISEGKAVKLTFAGLDRKADLRSILADNPIVRKGGDLISVDAGGVVVTPKRSTGTEECRLVLEYFVRLPPEAATGERTSFPIPLLTPEGATRTETRIRVWAEAGALPQLDGGEWFPLPVEEVTGEVPGDPSPLEAERLTRLPILVLRSTSPRPTLVLRCAEKPKEAVRVLADRALVRVTVKSNGEQQYRVGIRLLQTFGRPLDVKLPAPVALVNLKVTLNGLGIDFEAMDEKGQRAGEGSVARLRLPAKPLPPGSILEISYQLDPGRAVNGRYQTVLQPPQLGAEAGRIPTRWRITLPGSQVVLGPESGLGVRRSWTRRGWLPILAPAETAADLERWLVGKDLAVEEDGTVNQDCFRSGLEPLTVTYAPQQSWLLACSLVVVLFGLAVYLLLRRTLRGRTALAAGVLLFVLAVAAVATALLLPTVSAALLYGCQPALLVLLLGGLLLWLLHVRARRRQSFVSSFSRSRHGSSLLRPPAPVRPSGEPSTVDHSGSPASPSGAEAARSSSGT
jgi:hypothetical protein